MKHIWMAIRHMEVWEERDLGCDYLIKVGQVCIADIWKEVRGKWGEAPTGGWEGDGAGSDVGKEDPDSGMNTKDGFLMNVVGRVWGQGF